MSTAMGLFQPFILFLSLGLIFISLERIFPQVKNQPILRRGFLTDISHFLTNKFVNQFGAFVLTITIASTIPEQSVDSAGHVKLFILGIPLWGQVLLVFIIADLIAYFVHRATHSVPILWKFHSIHHSSQVLDWLAGSRLHFVDQVCIKTAQMVPVYLLGFSSEALQIFIFVSFFHAAFAHSNIQFNSSWLNHFIATPEYHHWHHSTSPSNYNKNYSGMFPLLDRIFGTQRTIDGTRPASVGLPFDIPKTFIGQLRYPFFAAIDIVKIEFRKNKKNGLTSHGALKE